MPVAYAGIEIGGGVSAQADANVSIESAGAVTVGASDTIDNHDMTVGSGMLSLAGIGFVYASNTINNTVNAGVGNNGTAQGLIRHRQCRQ